MSNETFTVHSLDTKDFGTKILPDIKEGKQLTIFCSFTYITPNYSVLFTLEGLKKFIGTGNYKVLLVMWDMNTLSNSYFRRLASLQKISSAKAFIDQKVEELRTIAHTLGFNKDQLLIYKSSDLWKKLFRYEGEDLSQQFYSLLAQMQVQSHSLPRDKVSHLIQIPMDLFFCNNFHRFYPADLDRKVDLVYFGQNKEKLYELTRELMLQNGLIEYKNPLFILMKNFPYLINKECVPEWNMALREIRDIVMGCALVKKDILTVLRHLAEYKGALTVKSEDKREEMEYNSFYKLHEKSTQEELSHILAENLYDYLQERKARYNKASGEIEESVWDLSKQHEVKQVTSVLKSDIGLGILLRSDGTRNTTKIAKELGTSVGNISTYANKLKKMKLVRLLPNGNLKRNIKGVKINLELGV